MTRQYVTAKAGGETQRPGEKGYIRILASGVVTTAGDVCLRVTAPPTDDHRHTKSCWPRCCPQVDVSISAYNMESVVRGESPPLNC
jgi:hypothetical protein